MASYNITQMRRIVIRKWDASDSSWDVQTIEPDSLGQDTIGTVNIAPRKRTRASAVGTSETPISGTFNAFAASITFMMDTFEVLGKAINRWNPATYAGAVSANGNITDGDGDSCNEDYYSVIMQGLCDDGSTVDIELTRCIPSVDDDLEFGTSETPTVTLNLNPIIYNSTLHSGDGYPAYSFRFGDNSLSEKQRLNVVTGAYAPVGGSE